MNLSARRVFLAFPTYSASLTVECVGSLIANLADLTRRGIVPDIEFLPGNCYVALARNELVASFLESGCSDLIFIDDDVGFPADGIWRLLQHDLDVVAGAYPRKQDETAFPVRLLPGARQDHETGLIECEGLPTGFMRISRSVLERMIEAMPERKCTDPVTGKVTHDLFACERVDGVWWGEDYRFCQLARSVGARLWLDPSMAFRHVGRNVWRGTFIDHIQEHPHGRHDEVQRLASAEAAAEIGAACEPAFPSAGADSLIRHRHILPEQYRRNGNRRH